MTADHDDLTAMVETGVDVEVELGYGHRQPSVNRGRGSEQVLSCA